VSSGPRRKFLQDIVLGAIEVEDPYLQALDQPVFQRLRRLEQLGPAALVYPTGQHTRFSHSIGVFSLARRAFDTLASQLPDEHAFNKSKPMFLKAALLHDVGHYPLSHTIEAAYSDKDTEFTKRLNSAVELDASGIPIKVNLAPAGSAKKPDGPASWIPGDKRLLQQAALSRRVDGWSHHEDMARVVIESTAWGLREFFEDDEERENAIRMIEGVPPNVKYGSLLTNLIHGVVDVDRLDYLLRDSASLGSSYGGVDVDRLLGQLRIYPDTYKTPYLAFPRKALPAVDHYLASRYVAYEAIAFHPVVTAFDVLARAAYWLLLKDKTGIGEFPRNTDEYRKVAAGQPVKGRASFLRVNDDLYWDSVRRLYELERAAGRTESLAYYVTSSLLERRPPKMVWELATTYKKRWKGYRFEDGKPTVATFGGDPIHWNLADYSEKCQRLQSAVRTVAKALSLEDRLFYTEQKVDIYKEGTNSDWDVELSEGIPGQSLILHEDGVPRTLESLSWGLAQELATLETRFFRVYAPSDRADDVQKAMSKEMQK